MGNARDDLRVADDGLAAPEVGNWAESKYRLISLYDELFAKGMKNKWGKRVYIDLYSGAGHSRIRGTERHVKGSPLLALSVSSPFDKYIFCEEDTERLEALRQRAKSANPTAKIEFVPGSCDAQIGTICAAIPRAESGKGVLSLCVVDPFDFGLKFETLRSLSRFPPLDFLVLLAVHMDANRAYEHYVDGNNPKIDEALGNTEWRARWRAHPRTRDEFPTFLAQEFAQSMHSLGFLRIGPERMKMVKSDDNVPKYYMALFSKHERAYKFWEEVLKYHNPQMGFSWEG